MLARLAVRLLLAPFGFACGVFVGFAILALISSKNFGVVQMFPEEIALLGYDLSVDAFTIVLLFAPLMGAPAIVAVLIAEMFSIRSWIYHASAGALTALMPWWLAPTGYDGQIFSAANILAAGLLGGLTHWLIAGRSSGLAALPAPAAERPAGADKP